MPLAYLVFEEVESSSTNLTKCEALISVLTLMMLTSSENAALVKLISVRLWKWFEKAREERFSILLGEGLAVASRLMTLGQPCQFTPQSAEEFVSTRQHVYQNNERQRSCLLRVLKEQVSTGREMALPFLTDDGLIEYPHFVGQLLENAACSRDQPVQMGSQVSPIYDIFGQKRSMACSGSQSSLSGVGSVHSSQPPSILKKLDDDHISVASGSTTSSRRPRMTVTFSDDGTGGSKTSKGAGSSAAGRCMTPVREDGPGQQAREDPGFGQPAREELTPGFGSQGHQQIGGSSSSSAHNPPPPGGNGSYTYGAANTWENSNLNVTPPVNTQREHSLDRTNSVQSNQSQRTPLGKTGSVGSVISNGSAGIGSNGSGGNSSNERRNGPGSMNSVGSDVSGPGIPQGHHPLNPTNLTNGLAGLSAHENRNSRGNLRSGNAPSHISGASSTASSRRRKNADFNKTHRPLDTVRSGNGQGAAWHEKSTPKLPSDGEGGSSSSSTTAGGDDSRPDTRQALSRCSGRSSTTVSTRAHSRADDESQSACSSSVGVGDMRKAFLNLKGIDRTTTGKTFNSTNNNMSQSMYSAVNAGVNATPLISAVNNTPSGALISAVNNTPSGALMSGLPGSFIDQTQPGQTLGSPSPKKTGSLQAGLQAGQQIVNSVPGSAGNAGIGGLHGAPPLQQQQQQHYGHVPGSAGAQQQHYGHVPGSAGALVPPSSAGMSTGMGGPMGNPTGTNGMGIPPPGSSGQQQLAQEVEQFLQQDGGFFGQQKVLSPEIKEKLKLLKTRRPNLGSK